MVKKIVIPATKKLGKELLKNTSKRLRVCAYVRVSTDTEEQLESFNAQISRYKRIICEEHAKTWEFAGIFADTESGTTIEKREQFQDMIDKCREGLIDLILVKQISRFGRNTIDTLRTVYELRKLGIEIYFEEDQLYGSDSRLDFMLTMLSGLAQEESRQTSIRVKSGIKERMESGNIAKRVRPVFGYRKDIIDKLYIYEPEAIVVRIIYLLYASGVKMHDVSNLAIRDFPKEYSKAFKITNIYNLYLSNPRYKGTVILQKTFKPNYVSKYVKQNKGELPMYIYENYHKAIIPPQFYEFVEERRKNRPFVKVSSCFTPILYCGLCTRNMNQVKKCGPRKGESYYSCNVYQNHKELYCDHKYLDGNLLDEIITNVISQLTDFNNLKEKIKETLKCALRYAIGSKKKYDLIKVNGELKTLNAELKNQEALMINIVNDIDFKNKHDSLLTQIEKLKKKIKIIENTDYRRTKYRKCKTTIDKLLEKQVVYSMLARLLKLKVIALPDYKLIFDIASNYTNEKEFKKQMHQIVNETKDKLFIDSLGVRHNREMAKYSFAIIKI